MLYADMSGVISTLMSGLFDPESRRLNNMVDKFIKQVAGTDPVSDTQIYGVLYQGERWNPSKCMERGYSRRGVEYLPVPADLEEEAAAIREDRVNLHTRFVFIRQMLVQLFKDIQTEQDLRDNTPEPLMKFHEKGIQAIPRSREVGYHFTTDLQRKRLAETLDAIDIYSSSELFT